MGRWNKSAEDNKQTSEADNGPTTAIMAVPQKSHAGDERLIGYFTVKEIIGQCGICNRAQRLSV